MAITVDFDGNILSGAESESDNGEWNLYNTKNSPTQETDFVFQNQYAISEKVSASTGGIEFEDDASVDLTTPYIVFAKIMVTTPGALDTSVAEALSYIIGDGADPDDCYRYYLVGLYAGDYPVTKTWLFIAIDPNEVAFRDAITGAPDLSIADYYGLYANMAGSAKAENVVHDRLDYMTYGDGLTLYGTTPDGVFDDFLDDDYGTQANRFGVIVPGEAERIVNGWLNIGDASNAAVFNDSNQVIVFPHQRVGEGFFGMKYDLTQASTDIDIGATVFKSLGNASTKMYFDTALEVDDAGAPDTITIAGGHGLSTGDYVLYSREGGSDDIGLTDSTYYFVRAVSDTTLAFYAVGATVGRQNSFTNTSPISLTTQSAPGENHSIIRDPDTRADHTATSTSGSLDLASCSIDGARVITLTSACTLDGGFILRTGNVSASTATVDSVSITCNTLAEGDALFDPLTTLDNITGCSIVSGDEGHFARLTATGTLSSNNTYEMRSTPTGSGFWNPSDDGWNFHTQTGIDSNIITTDAAHGFYTGEAVYYNDEGGTDTIGLTHGNKYYVDVASTTTLTVHLTKAAAVAGSSAITLSDGTTGETHSLYSANATLYNDSSGSITVNATGGTTPSVRNGTDSSSTVQTSYTLTVTVQDVNTDPIENVQVAIYTISGRTQLMNEDTNASGIATEPYSGGVPTPIEIRCRKASSGSPKYVNYSTLGTITGNFSLLVTLREDPNNNATS